jgi:Iron-regulated ABC transporter membrane component SufB
MQETQDKILEDVTTGDYKYGFVTDIETEVIPIGLNEDVVRLISAKKMSRTGCSNTALKHIVIGLQ